MPVHDSGVAHSEDGFEEFEHAARMATARQGICQEIGSREWDRTTDHLHVKEVLYH